MHPWPAHHRVRRAGVARQRHVHCRDHRGLPRTDPGRHSSRTRLRRRPRAPHRLGTRRVKLLLDENLSRRLAPSLQAVYPGSSQVDLLDLSGANDHAVWTYARAHDFAIVTKDDDYLDRPDLSGLHHPGLLGHRQHRSRPGRPRTRHRRDDARRPRRAGVHGLPQQATLIGRLASNVIKAGFAGLDFLGRMGWQVCLGFARLTAVAHDGQDVVDSHPECNIRHINKFANYR